MPDAKAPEPPRRPFQFGLGTLFLITALCSVLAAALGGMLRSRWDPASPMPPGFFELMAAAAPVAVVILLSLLRAVVLWLKRRRR